MRKRKIAGSDVGHVRAFVVAGISCCICCLALAACEIRKVDSLAPPRPQNVPAEAFWAGGADGGMFILMGAPKDGAYPTKVYHDRVGRLEFNGLLRLDEPGGSLDVKNPEAFGGWDGEVMHLRDGRTMRQAKK